MDLDNCHFNASCTDTEDGFICTCESGYSGDGIDCSSEKLYLCTCIILLPATNMVFLFPDIDECLMGTDSCDRNADCSDTDGSYTCTCHVGFSGDGETCCMW